MKKNNKPLRAAGILLLATMLTTCMTAGTFAKYTTEGSAKDEARVAQFGVTVTADGSLYGEEYDDVDGGNTIIAYSGKDTNTGTVQVQTTGTNVVAPGTKNDTGLGFGVNGTPEVDVKVTSTIKAENIFLAGGTYGVMTEAKGITEVNFATSGDLYKYDDTTKTYTSVTTYDDTVTTYYKLSDTATVADTGYYPVVYKLVGGDTTTSYTAGTTSADSLAKIKEILDTTLAEKTYEANTDLADELDLGSAVLTWEWKYEVDDTTANKENITDGADTILGDLMAGDDLDGTVVKLDGTSYVAPTAGDDYNLETSFDMTINVTQVD